MKLTKYVMDLGRVVAYFPGLRKVTGSTTASILLCQFLYCTDKTEDGWIYKNNYEIEEETGLTYYEQQTARKVLIKLGILEEEFKRWDRTLRFRINQNKLNDLWESETGSRSKQLDKSKKEAASNPNQETSASPTAPPATSPTAPPASAPLQSSDRVPFSEDILIEEPVLNFKKPQKKGDLLDGMLYYSNTPGDKKAREMGDIQAKIEKKFHIYATNAKWQKFIEFAWTRQTKHTEPAERFIAWALNNGWDPRYWTPEKCQSMWPQAFVSNESEAENFVKTPPRPVKPEEIAPMPEHLKTKHQRL